MPRHLFLDPVEQFPAPAKYLDPHFLLCEACGCMMMECPDPDCERAGDHFDGLCDDCEVAAEQMED
jgi:hypothetical protein